jgi:hypothetical protein
MFRPILTASRKRGQAMVESVIALFFALVIFLLMFDMLQVMKSKILVEYAAAKCARARAVGYNDFMLTKIARLSTMPVAGGCKTKNEDGGIISRGNAVSRMGQYLASEYEAQADNVLDFEYWDDTFVNVISDPSTIKVTVSQHRQLPFFDSVFNLLGNKSKVDEKDSFKLRVNGCSEIKTHYLDYLMP